VIEVQGKTHRSVELTDAAISQADCVILFIDHSVMPVERIIKHSALFDTRNATAGHAGGGGRIYRLGSGYVQPFNHKPKV
jgi:UDP-N-acetyl-D-glucosamine dehydrogenase